MNIEKFKELMSLYAEKIDIKFNEEQLNKRLDVFLSEQTEYSRSKITTLIKDGNILVNGSKVYTFNVNENIIYLSKCEVGKVNAAMLTTSLILKLKQK